MSIAQHDSEAEQAENLVSGSEAINVRGSRIRWSESAAGVKRGAGGRGAETER